MGVFDWKQSYIGKLRHATFDNTTKRIIIATEENVLASISLKTGEIAWRRVFEDPAKHRVELLHTESEITTVSGDGSTVYVRGWEPQNGMLTFEWSLTIEATNSKWLIHGEKLLHIVLVVDSHLEVTEYQVATGRNKGVSTKIKVPFMTDVNTCVVAGEYWACLHEDKVFYMSLISNDNKVRHRLIKDLIGDDVHVVNIEPFQSSRPSFLLIRAGITKLAVIDDELTVDSHNFTRKPIALDDSKMLTVENGVVTIIELSSDESTEVSTLMGDCTPILGVCGKRDICWLFATSSDDSLSLIQLSQGRTVWTREEALSRALAVEFVELPISAMDASIADAFAVNDSNDILSMLTRRLAYQAQQLKAFITGVKDSDDSDLVRDDFGLHKLIIIATGVGKLFALDTISGNIVWSKYIPNIKPFKTFDDEDKFFIFELRNARHAQPVMLLVARCARSGKGVMYKFNPIRGEILDEVRLEYKIKQMMKLPFADGENMKGVLMLTQADKADYYPESIGPVLKKNLGATYMYSTDEARQMLTGYRFTLSPDSSILALPSWTFRLPSKTHELLSIVVRPHLEHGVHSQGRVLADRSVAYKYVNPNLLAVFVQTRNDPLYRNVLSVYLVDGVTGSVVYGLNHKRARGVPGVMVHSENWLLYGYFNERFRRYELTSLELYEGSRQSNSTAFSSHALASLPQVETNAYILPTHPVHMATTLTERGITNKNILIALPSGAVVEVPWAILEPRYQIGQDEFAPPYIPEVPLMPEATVNYNRSVARLRGISIAPARLESTALVLLHGLDLFYTRVAPSRTFDVLKEDFDHWLIVAVLAGLTVASYVTKRLSKRKMVKQAWK